MADFFAEKLIFPLQGVSVVRLVRRGKEPGFYSVDNGLARGKCLLIRREEAIFRFPNFFVLHLSQEHMSQRFLLLLSSSASNVLRVGDGERVVHSGRLRRGHTTG